VKDLALIRDMRQGEKIAFIAASVLFLVVFAWVLLPGGSHESPDGVALDEASFEVESVRNETSIAPIEWGNPSPQGGPNWIFDIFTPPVIYYDEATRTFTVTPPYPVVEPVEDIFDLELVDIVPVPFRFQLVSYAGSKGNYLLTLENLDSGQDVFCGPHDVLTDHGLKVIDFVEIREVAASTQVGTTEAFDFVGKLVVEDQRTGDQYALRHNKITYLEDPVAHFVTTSGEAVRLAEGESWRSGSTIYTVNRIDLNSHSVALEKSSSDVGDRVAKILHSSKSFNSSDLSNRNTRESDPPPGAF